MTDTEKREKVMRGLECCAKGSLSNCEECPYTGMGCSDHLCADAFVLLREQEARVMSVEEIAERAACLDPDPIFVQWKTGGTAWIANAIDTIAGAAKAGNRNFRAWTSRPTPEQMRDTPWEGDSDAE